MFVLDPNVISELRKAGDGRADASVITWLSSVDASSLFLFAITLLELELSVQSIERSDALQGARLRTWLHDRILPECVDRTLPIDAAIALRCASLHVPDPESERDAFIAATALVHRMTIVTRNVTDFDPTPHPLDLS